MIKIRSLKAHNFKQLKEIRIKFPDRGSVLLEGRNEAGKSTLFEAIYFGLFGDALVTEDNRNDLKDLIEYSASMAVVEIVLEIRHRIMQITRTINREKANAWRLRIFSPEGEEEQVSKNAAVNDRIIREIGLDGDALLNSCFVEQKKLEKLEGLTAADRRRSLLRILNLESMEELEKQFRRRREDDFRVAELRDRVKLAQVLEQIPAREVEKSELEHQIALLEMNKALAAIEDRRQQIAQAKALIEELAPERVQLEERLEQIHLYKEGQIAADKIIVNLQRIAEWEHEIREIEARLSALTALEEALPGKEARLNSLAILARQLRRLSRLGDIISESKRELQSLRSQQEEAAKRRSIAEQIASRIRPALQQIEADHAHEERLAVAVSVADQIDALEGWRRSKSTADGLSLVKAEETKIREQHQADEKRHQAEQKQCNTAQRCMLGSAGACGLLLVLILISWFGLHSLFVSSFAVVGFVGLVFLTMRHYHRVRISQGNLAAIAQALQEHQSNLLRLEGQAQSLSAAGESGEDRLEHYEELLHGLEISIPDTLSACEGLLAELRERLGDREATELRNELAAVRESLAGQEAALKEMESQKSRAEDELRMLDETAIGTRYETVAGRAAKAEEIHDRWMRILTENASSKQLPAELQAVREAGVLLRNEISRNRKELAEREELQERIAARNTSIEELHHANSEMHPAIQAADKRAPDWKRETTAEQYQRVARYYSGQVKELDEPGAQSALNENNRKSHAAQGQMETHAQDIRQRSRRLAELCRMIGVLLPEGEIDRHAMEERIPALRKVPTDETALHLRRDQVAGELVHLERQRQELVAKLRLEGVPLDTAVCQHELRDFERDLKVRARAEQIVKQSREQLVSKVLPSTIEHMRRILPVLTMDRYHDAEITEDYKIRAWDERAGGWKAKNIFSGGTKDQFSLALRLAFALATLPQERGAAPGFIFLDEPLSSFDQERSLALMELITSGEIAEAFDQIFVISHSQVLDPSMFHHYLVMEDGRVASSTLDPLEEDPILPAAK